MTSTYKGKRSSKPDEIRKLLPQTSFGTIEDDLSTKSITQKRKKMRMETKEKGKLPTNNKKYLGEK